MKTVYELQHEILGEEDPETLMTLHDFTIALSEIGHQDKALEIERDIVYAKMRKVLGEDAPETKEALKEVFRMRRRVLENKENAFKMFLGSNLYREALRVARAIYEEKKDFLGEEDPDTLQSKYKLAATMAMNRQYDESLAELKETYEIMKRVFGAYDSETIATLHMIAMVLDASGKREEAIKMQRWLVNACLQRDKENKCLYSTDTIEAIIKLAEFLRRAGKAADAANIINWADSLVDEKAPGGAALKAKISSFKGS